MTEGQVSKQTHSNRQTDSLANNQPTHKQRNVQASRQAHGQARQNRQAGKHIYHTDMQRLIQADNPTLRQTKQRSNRHFFFKQADEHTLKQADKYAFDLRSKCSDRQTKAKQRPDKVLSK